MKLDSNRAWRDASRNVTRNRDALLAVAGVFFLLPQLALSLFFPQPEPTAGMSEQQIIALAQGYYVSMLPAAIPMLILQAIGTLSLLSLLRHATRPTVGGALRLGVSALPTYTGSQVLLGLGIVFTLVISILALSGVMALAIAGALLVALLAIGVMVRLSLTAAVIAVEGERNPVRALRRSWQLTAGNAWRLFGFYALFLVAFLVVLSIVSLFVNLPLQLMASGTILEVAAALVSAVMSALMALYLVAIIEAVHRQLAGKTVELERRTFE